MYVSDGERNRLKGSIRMNLENVMAALPSQARAAISELVKLGFEVFCNTRIEDTGSRGRGAMLTFGHSGRYNLVVCCQNVEDLKKSGKRKKAR